MATEKQILIRQEYVPYSTPNSNPLDKLMDKGQFKLRKGEFLKLPPGGYHDFLDELGLDLVQIGEVLDDVLHNSREILPPNFGDESRDELYVQLLKRATRFAWHHHRAIKEFGKPSTSPVLHSGLMVDVFRDQILRVDDHNVSGVPLEEVLRRMVSGQVGMNNWQHDEPRRYIERVAYLRLLGFSPEQFLENPPPHSREFAEVPDKYTLKRTKIGGRIPGIVFELVDDRSKRPLEDGYSRMLSISALVEVVPSGGLSS